MEWKAASQLLALQCVARARLLRYHCNYTHNTDDRVLAGARVEGESVAHHHAVRHRHVQLPSVLHRSLRRL